MALVRALLALSALSTARATSELVEVSGSGTTNPSKFFWQIMSMMRARTIREIRLNYRAVGSGTGQKEFSQVSETDFTEPLTDFGAGDIPMDQALYNSIVGAQRTMVHVPFSLGAIGIFHSIPAAEVPTPGLKTSVCLLAKIFEGLVTEWTDADVLAENPGLKVPTGTKIQVFHRTKGSSSTSGLSGYLDAGCTTWGLGSDSVITWPTISTFTPVQGSGEMASQIGSTPYAIGYLDAGHGHSNGFEEVMLQNADQEWLTSAMALAGSTNGVEAAATSVTTPAADADWSLVNYFNKPGSNTWPIVLASYLYIDKSFVEKNDTTVGLLKAFVDYVTGDGQNMLEDYSFVRHPDAQTGWQDAWAKLTDGLTLDPSIMFTWETDTTAWTGQGVNVISKKRNSYEMWKIDSMSDTQASLESRLLALEESLSDYGIVPLHGSGTTNPKNWFAEVMNRMTYQARVPLLLTYRAVGSSTGQKEFVGNEDSNWQSMNHFAAGDIPMTEDRWNTLTSNLHVMVHLPFALGAIAVFHNVPSSVLGSSTLKLSACLLARIFAGEITSWDHADILAENPGVNMPAAVIKVGHRTKGSSSTNGLTSYFDKVCTGTQWPLGKCSECNWPTSEGFTAVEGSPGMTAHISNTEYSIGYLDAGHGIDEGLQEVAFTNAVGTTLTASEAIANGGVAEAGEQGVFPTDATSDWSDVNLINMPGTNTWPIVLVSYLYVNKDQKDTNPKTASALRAFIDYILNDRGGLCSTYGFTMPSTTLNTLAKDAAATIIYPAASEKFEFEESTDAYVGMGENIISVKRHSAFNYRIGLNEDGVAALEAAAYYYDIYEDDYYHYHDHDDDDDDSSKIISVVALVFTCVSLLVSSAALYLVRCGGRKHSNLGGPAELGATQMGHPSI